MNDQPEQTNEYAGLLESLFDAFKSGQTSVPLSTAEMLQRSFDKVGGWMGEKEREAYLRGELPDGKTRPIP